ncbi:MAG: M28 family peptidase [Planctomycetaceae bacterium]|nr:M28 family peptidase [Planctomycetaceae bacterium]
MKIPTITYRFIFGLAALFVFAGLLHAQQVTPDKDRIIRAVRFLSEENFPRVATHANKEKTIDYIIGAITTAGLEATRNDFAIKQVLGDDDGVAIELQRFTYTNVHALKKGKTDKRIIIGAHYDILDHSPGADDNASGVAVLIELAHMLKATPELNCDIELASYDMEEVGLWGSRFHARKLRQQDVDVVCMLSLDMVGYYSDAENSQRYPVSRMRQLYGTRGDFLAMVGRPADAKLMTDAQKAFREGSTLRIESFPAPNLLNPLFARSDHAPFWWEDYPALFFTDTADYRTPYYHKTTDTWDTLDYDRMVQATIGLYHIILAIDAGTQSP